MNAADFLTSVLIFKEVSNVHIQKDGEKKKPQQKETEVIGHFFPLCRTAVNYKHWGESPVRSSARHTCKHIHLLICADAGQEKTLAYLQACTWLR